MIHNHIIFVGGPYRWFQFQFPNHIKIKCIILILVICSENIRIDEMILLDTGVIIDVQMLFENTSQIVPLKFI